jgi:DNA primase
MNPIEEIKDRLSIEDLVSQYVQLKKVGRSLKGLCPFHTEKTPSFIVSPERGMAYCFGCNKGGDIFKFIQEIENVDFGEALKILAEKTGVQLEKYNAPAVAAASDQRSMLIGIHEKAASFFEEKLWKTEAGAKVLEYLKNRGLNEESIRTFRIGFSPDSYDETNAYLLHAGYTKKDLVASGLALSRETTFDKIYDRFRGRLMFPVFDGQGRVIAFGGRALGKDQDPKYVNSPDTAIYHKGHVLYGFSHAKQAIKQKGEAIFVEGYMDLIATHQSGVKNVVATSGTALTLRQLNILKPFAEKLILSFDMDSAGQEAAARAYEISRDFDYSIMVATMPEGKDAAEYAKNHDGGLPAVFENAVSYGEYLYGKLLKTFGTDGLAAKKKIIHEFMPFFAMIRSSIEKDEFIRKFARDLDLKELEIYDEIKNAKLPSSHPARQKGMMDDAAIKIVKYTAEDLLLGLIINFPRVSSLIGKKMDLCLFSDRFKPIYNAFCDKYNDQRVGAEKALVELIPDDLKEYAQIMSLYVSEKYGEMSEEAVEKELSSLIDNLWRQYVNGKTRELGKLIREAEKTGDADLCKKLLMELSNINRHGSN